MPLLFFRAFRYFHDAVIRQYDLMLRFEAPPRFTRCHARRASHERSDTFERAARRC